MTPPFVEKIKYSENEKSKLLLDFTWKFFLANISAL
jgi:hypothetical protein